jgi:hypothetical protein
LFCLLCYSDLRTKLELQYEESYQLNKIPLNTGEVQKPLSFYCRAGTLLARHADRERPYLEVRRSRRAPSCAGPLTYQSQPNAADQMIPPNTKGYLHHARTVGRRLLSCARAG